ncbi:MAG: single-stranded DNA-binding protein [Planctomycetes bacterium]|nr:single-stranded DNA-binding protein [Planctomycetota bacterium]
MASLNKVLLIGNLTRDPELRQIPSGQSVCKLGLATNRKYKAQTGEMREEVTFVDVTVWGTRGETVARFFKKGEPIFIEGRLVLEEWTDKTSGQKRTRLSVTADDWQFVSSKGGGAGRSAGGASTTSEAPAQGGGGEDEASLDAGGGVPF